MALKQDIGPDPAMTRRKRVYLQDHEMNDETVLGFSKGTIEDRSIFRSDNYFGQYQNIVSQSEDLKNQNVKRIPMPKTRGQLKR